MSLRAMTRTIRASTLTVPAAPYLAARRRHPALVFLPTVADALAALDDERAETYPRRDAVTRALLAEHQRSPSKLFSSALISAYSPMLLNLRRRLVSDALPSDELDQVVLTAFLDAINHSYGDRVAMRLRQRTQRAVFAAIRKEHDHPSDPLEDDIPDDSSIPKHIDLARLMNRAARKGVPRTGLEVVETTVLRKETLRAFVKRTGPADPHDRERMYQRLKRQRSRAMQHLRAIAQSPIRHAEGLSPIDDSNDGD